MGTTYILANTAKRQYFDPDGMGSQENSKRSGVLWGLSGHALAELLLPNAQLGFHLESWIGDPLVLVGDDGEPNSIPRLAPFQESPDQDAWHIVTQRFDNITLNLIAQLCERLTLLQHFLKDAQASSFTFLNLVHAVEYLAAAHIEGAVAMDFGNDWRDRYYEILEKEPYHYPLPMTPETKAGKAPKTIRAIDVIRSRKTL